ncbi:MAG TPA: DNA repair protein RadA, partial [Pelagibacterium sp.]|nr:DNA repair protein RadA [Pelagibacterium sp.]
MPADAVYFGEVSLSGGVRPVVHANLRVREAAKLGFGSVHTAKLNASERTDGVAINEFSALAELVGRIAAAGERSMADAD